MKWITRAHVHVDRVACPWLIKRFVDAEAEFIFVARDLVDAEAQRLGAIPFDAPGDTRCFIRMTTRTSNASFPSTTLCTTTSSCRDRNDRRGWWQKSLVVRRASA